MAEERAQDAEFHLSFGLHSGIPLCCAHHFAYEGGKGGPCPKCAEDGVTREEFFSKYHMCSGSVPACEPYLRHIESNAMRAYTNGYRKDPDRPVEEDAYGVWLQLPMSAEFRDMLRAYSWTLAHICWPGPSEYWYIFLRWGSKEKGTCGVCSKKFSLAHPTAGKSVR